MLCNWIFAYLRNCDSHLCNGCCVVLTLGLPLLLVVLPREDSNGAVSRDVVSIALRRQHHVIPPRCYPRVEGPTKVKEGLASRLVVVLMAVTIYLDLNDRKMQLKCL